jgi:hypothetical protein
MEPDSSISYYQEPTIDISPDSEESNSHLPTTFL